MKLFRKTRNVYIAVLLVAGVIIGLGISIGFDDQTVSVAEKGPVPMDTQRQLNAISTALTEVAAAVSPSVVNVSTTRKMAARSPAPELYNHPFFRRFFDTPSPREEQGRQNASLGSGVIVSSDGHILTNNHVIENAETISITLHDKSVYDAELLGADPKTDLALLKIDADDLPALALNDRQNLQVGEIVVAVGIPFGLSHTVTMGIVSAVGRSNIGIVDYEDFIQTDAAINPGNSGGALVNSGGELVGINTAIFSTSGGNMGVGFAIPVQMAKSVMDSLLEHGKVIRGWLGVGIQPITPELAEYFDLEQRQGALISQVVDGSPADDAGLEEGDVVVSFNGKDISDPTELKNMAAATAPGTEVTMQIVRRGSQQEREVRMGEYPEKGMDAASPPGGTFFGASLQDLSDELKEELDIPQRIDGVLVVHVDSGSTAEGILRQNDVIVQVNRKDVDSRQRLFDIINDSDGDENVLLLVYRDGRTVYLTIAP